MPDKNKSFYLLGAPTPGQKDQQNLYATALKSRFDPKNKQMEDAVIYLHRVLERQINKARGLLAYNALLFAGINQLISHKLGANPAVPPDWIDNWGRLVAIIACAPLLYMLWMGWDKAAAYETADSEFDATIATLRTRTYLINVSIYGSALATIAVLIKLVPLLVK